MAGAVISCAVWRRAPSSTSCSVSARNASPKCDDSSSGRCSAATCSPPTITATCSRSRRGSMRASSPGCSRRASSSPARRRAALHHQRARHGGGHPARLRDGDSRGSRTVRSFLGDPSRAAGWRRTLERASTASSDSTAARRGSRTLISPTSAIWRVQPTARRRFRRSTARRRSPTPGMGESVAHPGCRPRAADDRPDE